MSDYKSIFYQRLKDLRSSKGIAQHDLAQKVGVIRQTLSHWETGRREPDIKSLINLADALEVSLDYLVGRSDER